MVCKCHAEIINLLCGTMSYEDPHYQYKEMIILPHLYSKKNNFATVKTVIFVHHIVIVIINIRLIRVKNSGRSVILFNLGLLWHIVNKYFLLVIKIMDPLEVGRRIRLKGIIQIFGSLQHESLFQTFLIKHSMMLQTKEVSQVSLELGGRL